jgi:antitoxin ParD1/3/4
MTTMQVSLPDTATEFIERQISSGQFATPSEYVSFLIEQARAGADKQKLDDMLEQGLSSGTPIPFTEQWWQRRKSELLAGLPPQTHE